MKFIKLMFFCLVVFSFSSCKKNVIDPAEIVPEYGLLKSFSSRIKTETGLVLIGYGINNWLPKEYEFINGVANFSVGYFLYKRKGDEVSLDYARKLVVSLSESLLNEINSDPVVKPDLDVYPFTSDLIRISINFKDENKIDLGQGVAEVFFSKGKIKYEGYEIHEYRDRYPASGKHYLIHEETYAEALEIVKNQGSLIHL